MTLWWRKLIEVVTLPRVTVDLMYGATRDNAEFYRRIVREFHEDTTRRHPKYPWLRKWQYGVALCVLPRSGEEYLMLVEGSARRNLKKSQRLGYVFERITFNDFLRDVGEIRASAEVRQGQMPDELTRGEVRPCSDPASLTRVHDYPYFGILKDGHLVAYAGCLVSGELCMIEQLYGHAAYQEDGIVPALILGTAGYILEHYPAVRYYGYGTYYGAGHTMRRFKRKFRFLPHRVKWVLDGDGAPSSVNECGFKQLVYRCTLKDAVQPETPPGCRFIFCRRPLEGIRILGPLWRCLGPLGACKLLAKLAAGRRQFGCILLDDEIAGWFGVSFFCRHYAIDPGSAVIGPVWTHPKHRGKGIAPYALQMAMKQLQEEGVRTIYVDTSESNHAMQSVIRKCDFGEPVSEYRRPGSGSEAS